MHNGTLRTRHQTSGRCVYEGYSNQSNLYIVGDSYLVPVQVISTLQD